MKTYKAGIIGLGQIAYEIDLDTSREIIWSHAKTFFVHKKTALIMVSDIDKTKYNRFFKSTKQYKRAIPYYSIVLNNQDLDEDQQWRLLYMRGICYERINNWESAEEDFIKSLDINPESPQVLNYLAYSWIEKNVFLNESLKMLKKAYEKNPKSHYILDSLAWAHFKKNNLKIASQLMEEVIIRAPAEAISLDHLGDIYFAMGRRREALYMWRQAKDLAEPEDNIIDKILIKLNKYDAE